MTGMKVQTISITVPASRDEVFTYLAEVANIPHWAPEFCRSIRRCPTAWKVTTPAGERFFAVEPDRRTGVIDFLLGEQLDEMSVFPLRVISMPHGSAVIATYFQAFGMANETYDRDYRALLAALRGLMRRFGGGELHADGEDAPSFYPNLVTGRFHETWDFYTEVLGFRTVAECDVYVHLRHPSGAQFGLLQEEQDGAPAELISCTDGRGFWLSIDVPDADAEHARLQNLDVPIVEQPSDQPWGERRFIVRDPNGVLIWIAHRIPIADHLPEMAAAEA